MERLSSILLCMLYACIIQTACIAQEGEIHTFRFQNGSEFRGTVVDNFPPVYAIIDRCAGAEFLVDYFSLTTESADRLATMPALRYDRRSMPEIEDVTVSIDEHTALDLVHFKDGKLVAGIVERPRFKEYLILRWPSGEEWLCYYTDIDSVSQIVVNQPVSFQEFRHYYTGTAAVLSILFPAAGHIYNGDYLMAGVHLGALGVSVLLAGVIAATADGFEDLGRALLPILCARFIDIIDAGITASNREKRRIEWQQSRCTQRNASSHLALDLGAAPIPGGGAVGISIRF